MKSAVPFGLGRVKPKHFRDMARIAWKNRDNLDYAWKVLSRGVCDGCALGVAGFHDWTIDSVHMCMTRLNLLRLNTMPALDLHQLEDISKLQTLDNAQLRELGRLPFSVVREKNARGFRRISWDEAYAALPGASRVPIPAAGVLSHGARHECLLRRRTDCFLKSGGESAAVQQANKQWPPPVQARGRISIPLILGFSTLGVNVIFNLPSVTSTSTLST